MNATSEMEVEAALAVADRKETYAQRKILDGIRQWVIPQVVSENYDMIASRILAAEVRRLRDLQRLCDCKREKLDTH
jgi:predicted phosphohydrolase